MNIDSIKSYPTGSIAKLKHRGISAYEFKQESTDNLKHENLNTQYYSGSFTGKEKAAAAAFGNFGNTVADKIFRSGFFHKTLEIFEEKSVVASAIVSLFVAGGLRPMTNLAMAGDKDREDSIYAASHAISSAVIGLVISTIVMRPFDKAFKKIKEDPKKYLTGLEKVFGIKEIGKRKLEKSKPYKIISKMAQMGIDSVALGIPKALLTIALIPPILKYVFHMEKGKKHNAQAIYPNNNYVQSLVKSNPILSPNKGGQN